MGNNYLPAHEGHIEATVRKTLSRKTRDVHLIDDVCQDVLLTCWRKQQDLKHLTLGSFDCYVVRMALNRLLSSVRKRKPAELPETFEGTRCDQDPARIVENQELACKLRARLSKLPHCYRDIVQMRVDGFTHEQIALACGLSVNAVKTRFHRAKHRLEQGDQ